MHLQFKTVIPFRKRTELEPGEILKIRDGQGRVVEMWECVSAGKDWADFSADGYADVANI